MALEPDGRSRGFGTVLYATLEDGKKAIGKKKKKERARGVALINSGVGVEMLNGFEYQGRTLRVHFDKFATGSPHYHQPRTTHDYLPSRFGNIEFSSQSPDPDVLESLKQTYGSNTNSNGTVGTYGALPTGKLSFAPTDLAYDPYLNSHHGSHYGSPLAHHYERQQPIVPSNPRPEHDSSFFGYYSSPLVSHSSQYNASSVGTEGDSTQSLFRYSSHWSPQEQQPPLYSSSYQQQYDFYRPASHPQQDELSQGMQRMKLGGEENGESRNGVGLDGKNSNSATARGVWDPLNRLRL